MKKLRKIMACCLSFPVLMVFLLGTGCTSRFPALVAINSGFKPKVDNRFPTPVPGIGVLRVQYPFSIDSIDGKPGPNDNGQFGLYDVKLQPGPHVLRFVNGELAAHSELSFNMEAGCAYKLVNFIDRGRSRAIVIKNDEQTNQ